MTSLPSNLRGHLAAFFTISVWAITFISIKVLLVPFTPMEITFYRLALALAALLIVAPPRPGKWEWAAEWKFMAAGLFGVTLYFIFQNVALSYTLAANVSVLVSVNPLFTALAARLFLGEKLKANFFLGFVAAILGIILIAFNGSLVLKLNPLGDLLSILAALVWAGYVVMVKKASSTHSPLLITRKVFTYGFLFMLPLLPLFDFRWGIARLAEPANLLNLLFLGVVASALCFFTWNYAVGVLGPVKTTVYIYAVPVITIIASALFLKEPITAVALTGMALILAGMALSERNITGKTSLKS
jgi:drug/metabolite transporter (DMT)-like permease